MSDARRSTRIAVLSLALAALLPFVASGQSEGRHVAQPGHHGDCGKMTGIKQARCERHERMFEKCHAIRGEAHHECDRQFIVNNPLDCSQLAGGEARACEQERDAVRACSAESGRAFFRCVREVLRADPRH